MSSEKQQKELKPIQPVGIDEEALDKKINEALNKIDALLMDGDLENMGAVVFIRSKFDKKDELREKTAMAFRKREKNTIESPEIMMHILMFIFKKIGFKEDAVHKFLADQIKAAHPELENPEQALSALLNPSSPN